MFYQNYSNVFVILDYEITADSVVYLFTQNYTQTAIACGENKQLISIEMYLDVYWRNNGSIVNVNIIQRVSNKLILYKVTCVVVLEHFLSEHCSRCVCTWVKCREQNFTAGYTLYNYVCIKKIKTDIFFFTKPIMVKCLNIGKNISKPIYRSISLC